MMLVAMARTRFDDEGIETFSGKITLLSQFNLHNDIEEIEKLGLWKMLAF